MSFPGQTGRMWYVCSFVMLVVFKVKGGGGNLLVFVKCVIVSAVRERHLGLSVQGSVSEVRRESGGGGVWLCA